MKNRKKLSLAFLAGLLALGLVACGGAEEPAAEEPEAAVEASDDSLRLTTTTSVQDSGLLDAILPDFEEKTGYTVSVVAKGSGAAIEDGRLGNADAILVHSPAAEEEFVDEGYGINRQTFMHNYFVIVGPEADPAGIEGMDASAALEAIANNEDAKFASRGDESGTHTKELGLWEEIGVEPDADMGGGERYLSLGKGMGDTLTFASEEDAYTLTDLSTYLSMQDKLDGLVVLVDESENLRNDYSTIEVNPEMNENINAEAAQAFSEWIVSEDALALIAEYGMEEYGQPLFFVNDDIVSGADATVEETAQDEDPADEADADAPADAEGDDQVADAGAEEGDGAEGEAAAA